MTAARRPPILLERGVVKSREELMPGVWLLRLHSPRIAATVLPCQFFHVQCAEGADPLLRRPFSVSDVDQREGTYDLLFNVVGQGTAILSAAEAGQAFEALGPLGRPFSLPERGSVMVVGGGLGVAPFPFVARAAAAHGVRLLWLNGAYTSHQLYPVDRLAGNAETWQVTDDGSSGQKGFVTDWLRANPDIWLDQVDLVHACGPTPMLMALARLLVELDGASSGLPRCEVSLEAPMGCALGTCLGCVVPSSGWTGGEPAAPGYARVCVEGAVFDWRELDWARWGDLGDLVHHRSPPQRPAAFAEAGA